MHKHLQKARRSLFCPFKSRFIIVKDRGQNASVQLQKQTLLSAESCRAKLHWESLMKLLFWLSGGCCKRMTLPATEKEKKISSSPSHALSLPESASCRKPEKKKHLIQPPPEPSSNSFCTRSSSSVLICIQNTESLICWYLSVLLLCC